MKRLQPVIWSKGTLLTPQHLQAQDRFFEDALQFQIDSLNFQPWGFSNITIDPQMLAGGVFSISSASGIFHDGLLFDIPHSDPAPPVKSLAPYFEGDTKAAYVYLGVPAYRDRGVNTSTKTSTGTRFVSVLIGVRDDVLGSPDKQISEKQIQIARKNFSLFVEGDNPEGNSLLRMARVERVGKDAYRLDPKFIPPLLDMHASPRLVSIARDLVELVGAKSTGLGSMRRQKSPKLMQLSVTDAPRFWMLRTVNTYFPVLRHLAQNGNTHPEVLFRVLSSLAGELTTFSNEIGPVDLPLYDHDALSERFAELDSMIRKLLIMPDNVVSIPLRLFRPFVYSASLSDEKYFKNTTVYLAVSADMNRGELIAKSPHLIRVWSASGIDQRVNHALPGIALRHVTNPLAAIPVKSEFEYFSMDTHDATEGWESVKRARNIAAHIPSDIPNPKLELIIVLPDEAL